MKSGDLFTQQHLGRLRRDIVFSLRDPACQRVSAGPRIGHHCRFQITFSRVAAIW